LSHFISILLLGSERFSRRHELGAHRVFSWVHAEKSETLGFVGYLQNSLLRNAGCILSGRKSSPPGSQVSDAPPWMALE
jgi:hypothetical protein